MKQFGWVILILLIVHLLGVAGGAVWLAASGRVNSERLHAAVGIFQHTVADEESQLAKAAAAEVEVREAAAQAAKLEAVAAGPLTLNDRLAYEEQKNELAMHRLERLRRETGDLRQQIERAQDLLTKQKAELQAERRAFEQFVADTTDALRNADFQRAVTTYEQLKPRQAKEMFRSLLADGQEPEVVEYLAAMQLRKAAAILKEFKSPEEVSQATRLVEQLRKRGVYADSAPTLAEVAP